MRPSIAFAIAAAADDRRIVLVDDHALGAPELLDGHVLEFDPQLLGDHLGAGQHSDVLQHRLAAVAEARRLDRAAPERAADVVDDQRRQGLALDVLGDDQQRRAGLRHCSSSWIRSLSAEILRSTSSTTASSSTASIFSASVTK